MLYFQLNSNTMKSSLVVMVINHPVTANHRCYFPGNQSFSRCQPQVLLSHSSMISMHVYLFQRCHKLLATKELGYLVKEKCENIHCQIIAWTYV